MRAWSFVLIAIAGCDASPSTPLDGAPIDGAPIDGAPIDGSPIDGSSIDAADVEAADAAPLRCAETTVMLIDFAPRRIHTSAALGATLYLATHDPGDFGAGGAVVAIAMGDLTVVPIAMTGGLGTIRAVGEWIYVADGGAPGTVWRYQPGQAIETLASGRDQPITATADATHVYWREGASAPMVMRAPLTGGPATPVAAVDAHHLAVDDQRLYAGTLAGSVCGFRKDNWFNNWNSESVLLNAGMLLDGGEVVVLDNRGVFAVRPPATTFTPIATVPDQERHHGLALAGGYLWATAGPEGVKRVLRTGGTLEQVTPMPANGDPVFADGYLTWTSDGALYRCRP